MESITLQMLELELGNYKKMDLEKKIDIAVNINEKMKKPPTQDPDAGCSPMDKISDLTGVSTAILQQIRNLEDVSRKFTEWLIEEEISASMNVMYATMKDYLQDYYTYARKIPTKSGLLAKFHKRERLHVQAVFNKYFTRIQLRGTQHSIMVEKPEIVMNRRKYLRKKMEFLREQKVFVYIEDVSFDGKQRTSFKMRKPNDNNAKRLVLAVSPHLGYVDSIYCCRTTESNLRHWFEEKVLPVLPPGCVFIVDDNLFGNLPLPPKSHVPKKEMINWLVQNDIPHDPQSHRAELFALIETYKTTYRKVSTIDHILQPHGHIALYREEGVVFEYFIPFWKKLKQILDSKESKIVPKTTTRKKQLPFIAKRVASLIQKEYWQELQKKLLDLEMIALRKDQEMEELIEKLVIYAASEQFDAGDTEFDDYCEAMSQEYIFG